MTNYTHLVIDVEKEFGPENILEHLDDPRILQFKKLLSKPQFIMTESKLEQLQFYFDQGNQNIEDIANHTSTPIGAIKRAILSHEIYLGKWKLKNKQFKQAQELLNQGRKADISGLTGMNHSRIDFFFTNGIFNLSKYKEISRYRKLDIQKAQDLLDKGMRKVQIASELNILPDALYNAISKGRLSDEKWMLNK